MGLFDALFPNKARAEALRLGIAVTDIEHECSVFDRRNNFLSLSKKLCARYALPSSGRPHEVWQLLQRDKAQGAQLPNGYMLKSAHMTDALLDKLRLIAEEFSEEMFEFEHSLTEVAVIWKEYGGAAQTARIHRALLSLKRD